MGGDHRGGRDRARGDGRDPASRAPLGAHRVRRPGDEFPAAPPSPLPMLRSTTGMAGHRPAVRRRQSSVARAAVHLLSDDPFVPEPGTVYWLETTVLPGADPAGRRPVVVVAVPDDVTGTVTVVVRSGTDDFGVEHPAGGRLGFPTPGRFSRRHPVQCQLWTSANAVALGPLDADAFASVLARFAP